MFVNTIADTVSMRFNLPAFNPFELASGLEVLLGFTKSEYAAVSRYGDKT